MYQYVLTSLRIICNFLYHLFFLGPCIQIACGAFHTVVIMRDGMLYGFGSDRYGQLGQGGATDGRRRRAKNFLGPVAIRSKLTTKYKQVACGKHHTLALAETNRVMSWGYGTDGQLGHGPSAMLLSDGGGEEASESGSASERGSGSSSGSTEMSEEDVKKKKEEEGSGSGNGGGAGGGGGGGVPQKSGDDSLLEGIEEDVDTIGDNGYRPKLIGNLMDKQVSGSSKIQLDGLVVEEEIDTKNQNNNSDNEKLLTSLGPRIPGCGNLGREKFCMIACGHVHTLSLTVGGRVYAWGDNTRGQLGVHTSLVEEGKTRSAQDIVKRMASASAQSKVRIY